MDEIKTGWWDVAEEVYYRDAECVSHSQLEVFRRSIPEYAGRFVTRTIAAPEPTPAMTFGKNFHCAVLEPVKWQGRAIEPRIDGRTKEGKIAKQRLKEFMEATPGAIVVDAEDEETISAMAESCLRHGFLGDILRAQGICERPYVWRDGATLLPCKAKPDKVVDGAKLVIDLKTCENPSPESFARNVVSYGYGRQAAWYLDGLFPGGDGQFIFAAVGKLPPHEVVCYSIGRMELELFAEQNANDLGRLAACRASGEWASRWPELEKLTIPFWAFK